MSKGCKKTSEIFFVCVCLFLDMYHVAARHPKGKNVEGMNPLPCKAQ